MNALYKITGMNCQSCALKVQKALSTIPEIETVLVDKSTDSATITSTTILRTDELRSTLKALDTKYDILAPTTAKTLTPNPEKSFSWIKYKPLLVILFYILLITLAIQYLSGQFIMTTWMRHFMAAFFLTFSFFKLLDLKGFAASYLSYDILAMKWKTWGYIYPFVELGLGMAYLIGLLPIWTNTFAFIIMSLSLIGVVLSVTNKREIQCACLGTVFDLPMSTVTIIEDSLMILMSGSMILYHLG